MSERVEAVSPRRPEPDEPHARVPADSGGASTRPSEDEPGLADRLADDLRHSLANVNLENLSNPWHVLADNDGSLSRAVRHRRWTVAQPRIDENVVRDAGERDEQNSVGDVVEVLQMATELLRRLQLGSCAGRPGTDDLRRVLATFVGVNELEIQRWLETMPEVD